MKTDRTLPYLSLSLAHDLGVIGRLAGRVPERGEGTANNSNNNNNNNNNSDINTSIANSYDNKYHIKRAADLLRGGRVLLTEYRCLESLDREPFVQFPKEGKLEKLESITTNILNIITINIADRAPQSRGIREDPPPSSPYVNLRNLSLMRASNHIMPPSECRRARPFWRTAARTTPKTYNIITIIIIIIIIIMSSSSAINIIHSIVVIIIYDAPAAAERLRGVREREAVLTRQ